MSGDPQPAAGVPSVFDRRSFDRLVNFTDAVVAIGITLQLLPIIDIAGPTEGQTVWQVISANWGQVIAFLLSFVVVISMWIKHNYVFNVMQSSDGTIVWLNVVWLVLIVFLPWPTALYGTASSSEVVGVGGVGLLYWWNLAAISGVGSLMARHVYRTPRLLEPSLAAEYVGRRDVAAVRGWSFFIIFVLIGVASEFAPSIAPYFAFVLFPLDAFLRRRATHHGLNAEEA